MNKNCKESCGTKIMLIVMSILIGVIIVIQCFCMTNGQTIERDILSALYQNNATTQIGDTLISFDENSIQIGDAITHEEGSNVININEDGVYQISYQLYGTRETIGIFNFNAVILVNSQPIESTLNEGPILEDNFVNRMTLTGIVFLQLQEGYTLQLGGVSVENIRYTRARIDIEKIS